MVVASDSSPPFLLCLEDRNRFRSRAPGRVEISQSSLRPRELHQRLGRRPLRLRAPQVRGQAVEVVDLPLGKARDHVEAAGVLELARKAGREVAEQGLRLHPGLLRQVLGALRALRAEVREDRRGDGADGEHDADGGDLPGADQRVACCGGPLALLLQHLLGGFARFALMPQVAARLDHAAQHVVRSVRRGACRAAPRHAAAAG